MDIDSARQNEAMARLQARGLAVTGEVVDVSSRASLAAASDAVVGREGCIDVVFANAGVVVPFLSG